MQMCLNNRWTHLEIFGAATNDLADFLPSPKGDICGNLGNSQHFNLPQERQQRTLRTPYVCTRFGYLSMSTLQNWIEENCLSFDSSLKTLSDIMGGGHHVAQNPTTTTWPERIYSTVRLSMSGHRTTIVDRSPNAQGSGTRHLIGWF